MDADVIVVGAGLAGLVADSGAGRRGAPGAAARPGARVEPRRTGVLVVRRPVPRRLPRAAPDGHQGLPRPGDAGLAGQRRRSTAASTTRPARTSGPASGPRRTWTSPPARNGPGCTGMGVRWFPVVGWAERGGVPGRRARQLGAALPRHLGHRAGRCSNRSSGGCARPWRPGWSSFAFRHRVDGLTVTDGVVDGVRGAVLEPSDAARGTASSRTVVGEFELHAPAVIVTSGGIGADHDLVRANWPARLGRPPQEHDLRRAGARRRPDARDHRGRRRPDRQPRPDVALHRGRPQLGPDLGAATASGSCPARRRCGSTPAAGASPPRTSPASTPCGTLKAITDTGYDHSWFVLTQKIIEKEFALSGSEQNPDLTGKDIRATLSRIRPGAPAPVEAFKKHGRGLRRRRHPRRAGRGHEQAGHRRDSDDDLDVGGPLIDLADLERQIVARDREIDNPFTQGPAGHGDPRRPALPRRPAHPHGHPAQDPRPGATVR